jgi:tRNA G37 N-methylase TrmD
LISIKVMKSTKTVRAAKDTTKSLGDFILSGYTSLCLATASMRMISVVTMMAPTTETMMTGVEFDNYGVVRII